MSYLKHYFIYIYFSVTHLLKNEKYEFINGVIHKTKTKRNETTTLCFMKGYWTLHREDDKFSFENDHKREWYKYGVLHRDNFKPAKIYNDYQNFEFSMKDMPIGRDYYLNGNKLSKEEISLLKNQKKISDF